VAHENTRLIEEFYTAFSRRDPEAMAACYHDEVRFADPVFTDLRGEQARNMWRMLCSRAEDLVIEFSGVSADGQSGRAHWEARYTFQATGRNVHNCIDAAFRFDGGKIIDHRDRFGFWKWTRMALGPVGLLLGWSPIVQGKVRAQAASGLADWSAKHAD
jgi:ketosteroid isomerase-like protein